MKYSLLVAQREFADNAKTKGFWIGLLLFPLILWGSITLPRILEERAKPARTFVLIDYSNDLGASVRQAIDEDYEKRKNAALLEFMSSGSKSAKAADQPAPENGDAAQAKESKVFEPPRRKLVEVPLPDDADASKVERLRETMRPYLLGDKKILVDGEERELFAMVVLPDDVADRRLGIEYWSTNQTDDDLPDLVEKGLNEELRARAFLEVNVPMEKVKEIGALKVKLDEKDPKKEAGKEKVGLDDKIRQWAPVGFVYLLFVSVMSVAQMLLNNTIEEKSNRLVEVLLSSVTAWELMFGKLLGIAAVGITMLVSWVVSGAAVLKLYAADEVPSAILRVVFQGGLLAPFLLYFLLGYLLYASIFLAIGSFCNTLKEAQNFMGPVMVILMVPLITMMFIAQDPNGTVARVLSWIPVFTPFVMMNRAAADPPMLDLVGTTILLAATVWFAIWASGRIFRVGILRTGQPPKILELVGWVRSS